MEALPPRPDDRQPAAAPAGAVPAAGGGGLRFAVTIGAWFVGLFGLMRLGWVESNLLTPFAQLQQRVAEQLMGVKSGMLYADASCSGGDPMALCMGAIFAYPAAWGSRLRGAAVGLAAITAINVVRLGSLSMVAENRTLLDVLHLYVWPGILIVVAAAYVYRWMDRQGSRPGGAGGSSDGAAPAGAPGGAGGSSFAGAVPAGALGTLPVLGGVTRRFLVLTAVLVAAYFAAAPFFYGSDLVRVLAGWVALTGGAILTAGGTETTVMGAGLFTPHGGFLVTQECVFTPLIPVYLAGVLAAPLTPWRRAAALAATPVIFFAVGVSRVLVLAVPVNLVGNYEVAIHGFSQTLVSVLLVAAAAVWTAGSARPGRRARPRGGGRGRRRRLRRRPRDGPPARRRGGRLAGPHRPRPPVRRRAGRRRGAARLPARPLRRPVGRRRRPRRVAPRPRRRRHPRRQPARPRLPRRRDGPTRRLQPPRRPHPRVDGRRPPRPRLGPRPPRGRPCLARLARPGPGGGVTVRPAPVRGVGSITVPGCPRCRRPRDHA